MRSRQFPYVYAIFPAISAGNECNPTQNGSLTSITMPFYPGELSTVDSSGVTKVFNFADLPCPPTSVHNPNESPPFGPLLAAPIALYSLNPTWQFCIAALPGTDPSTPLPSVKSASGPGGGFPGPIYPPDYIVASAAHLALPAHKARYFPLQTNAPS